MREAARWRRALPGRRAASASRWGGARGDRPARDHSAPVPLRTASRTARSTHEGVPKPLLVPLGVRLARCFGVAPAGRSPHFRPTESPCRSPHTAIDPLSRVGASSGTPPWLRASWPPTPACGLRQHRANRPRLPPASGSTTRTRRTSPCSWCPARRTPRWTGRPSTSTSRTSATAAATPPASSASAPAPATCSSWSSSTPTASRATSLAKYLPALRSVNGTDSHAGPRPELHRGLADRRRRPGVPGRRRTTSATASTSTRPSRRPRPTACGALGQFIYYDAIVMHGPGDDAVSFGGIRETAMAKAAAPAQGGDETTLPQRLPRRRESRR